MCTGQRRLHLQYKAAVMQLTKQIILLSCTKYIDLIITVKYTNFDALILKTLQIFGALLCNSATLRLLNQAP